MASNGTVAHRFANKNYNFEKGMNGSSVHISGKNYYSYSTVFGQWVDENVCLVFHGDTSITSHKHFLWGSDFPKDVILLPYDDGGRGGYYGSWHGCDLLGWEKKFELKHRWKLMDFWMGKIYSALESINGGKRKNLDMFAVQTIELYWMYMELLCSLYKDTTLPKYIKRDTKYKKLAKAMKEGEREVRVLVDLLFGEGTYKAYYDYCARFRKADDKRAKVEALCARLGIASPYESSYRQGCLDSGLSVDQIRNLTAKERNELHFASIMCEENRKAEGAVKAKYEKNRENAYRWIVGCSPKKKASYWSPFDDSVYNNCVNKDNGVVYECSGERIYGFYWCEKEVSFKYDSFRTSADKEQWIANFYAMCKEVAMNRKAILTLQRIKAHTKEKASYWDDDIYVDDDFLKNNTTEAEYWYCEQFIRKQDKHYADEEARRRAAEIARKQREEEERKEKELQEKELQEKITREKVAKMVAEGIEGCRNLWRLHIQDINTSRLNSPSTDSEFFFGGNVLLRFSMNKDKIESSKHIRLTIPSCKAMWKVVSKWHENPASFKEMQIKTLDGTYTISSYEDDILTAGCHDIAYAEMERMYNEIVKLESEAA